MNRGGTKNRSKNRSKNDKSSRNKHVSAQNTNSTTEAAASTTLRFYLLPPPQPTAAAETNVDKSCYCDASMDKHGNASIHIVLLANDPQIPRTRYMHVIGAAIRHFVTQQPRDAILSSISLSCSSKLLPLNAVVAVGCLGFKVNSVNTSTLAIKLIARNKLRHEPKFAHTDGTSTGTSTSRDADTSAHVWQFRSAWDELSQCFRSSYYQLSSGTFAWCRPCSTPLVAEVTALKQRDRAWRPQKLSEQTWEKLMTAPPQTPVYLESMNRGAVFFGVAGDVQAKAMWLNTLPLPKTQLLNICRSRAYFADPRDAPALALELNKKLGASVAAAFDVVVDNVSAFTSPEQSSGGTHELDNDVDTVWTGAHLELLPLQALENLKHMWTLEHFVNLSKLSSNAAFTSHVLQGVPVGARHLVAPLLNSRDYAVSAAVSKHLCTVRACAVSLAIRPSLLESWLALETTTTQ